MTRPTPREPLLFRRLLKEKVWGGARLAGLLGVKAPATGPLGESWELSDYPGDETSVRGGAWNGISLRVLMQDYPEAILGRSRSTADGRFPLLVKFLDAGEDLSVQIHPPDGPNSPTGVGKTEAWYVVDATPGATVICGLKNGTQRETFQADAGDARVLTHLHEVPVRRGDCVFVPAGQTHAIRGGVVLCEIQQTSDVTFRMYDWGRVGLDAKPRELHLAQALAVVDYRLEPGVSVRAHFREESGLQDSVLAQCPYFRIEMLRADARGGLRPTDKLTRTWTVVKGSGRIEPVGADHFAPMAVRFGDVALIPGGIENVRLAGDGAEGIEILEGVAL
ncbi:MAG: class I mannose-6-phosphate isomerase [Planctomycetota bacterium]|nr:class I mannose-6-phosphate isomerase [Planctomycetota bacterium]